MGDACLAAGNESSHRDYRLSSSQESRDLMKWFAIKVRTGGELSAAMALTLRGIEVYSPMRQERRSYSDRMKVVDVAMFPGYVFCHFDIAEKVTVLSSPGVDHIVGFSGEPTPIAEDEIHGIRRLIDLGADVTPALEPGQKVRVTHGPLKGVDGVLLRDGNGSRFVVTIELLKRSAALLISEDELCLAG